MKKLNLVYFGTPDFSVPSVDVLFNHPLVNLKYIVSMPDRKSGRGYKTKSPEVIEFAKDKKIPFFQSENINKEPDFLNKLNNESIDAFIVLAFAQFLNNDVLSIPKNGAFNIHTSLLPKYRGAAPIQYALLNGDQHTGVSIQKMVKKMDAGDLALSHSVKIHDNETGGQLYTRLKYQAALCLNDFIYNLAHQNIEYTKQNEDHVSFAPTLKRDDGKIDFSNKTFEQIHNQVRALYPWPGTFTMMDNRRLKIFEIKQSEVSLPPGQSKVIKNQLHIGCQDKSLRVTQLQLEGKKRCSDIDLFNGYKGQAQIE